MDKNRALIIGAGSSIAGALLDELLADRRIHQVVCVSRTPRSHMADLHGERLQWLESDYSETSIERVTSGLLEHRGSFSRVFICNGLLHDGDMQPEKRLEELSSESFQRLFQANAIVPVLWLKYLCSVLKGKTETRVAVFSARVGSIDDNRSGGWYGYRASKAALNMLIRTAAIEYQRRAPNVQFVAFHPGTTDTPLSKPFQKNVPVGKLFEPEFVARQLLDLMSGDLPDENSLFLDWAGEKLAW